MLASQFYYQRTGKRFVYNIMPIENIESVIKYGLLCFNRAQAVNHVSIAMNEVQKRRSRVLVKPGHMLHEYANMYFTYHNAMMYKRKDEAEHLCVLAIASDVLDIAGCVVSDENAASSVARFYDPLTGIERIAFDWVFAQSWIHDGNEYATSKHKKVKCAEILVPNGVPYRYISGAYVFDEVAKMKLKDRGFQRTIVVRKEVFYRGGE